MILEFSSLKECEEESPKVEITNAQLRKKKQLEYFKEIKRNIIDFFLVHNDLHTHGEILQKSNSDTNLNKLRKKKKKISQTKNEIKYKNLNIEEESKVNNEANNIRFKNKTKKSMINNIECSIYYKNNNNINNNKEERIPHNKEKTRKSSNNNELDLNKINSSSDVNFTSSINKISENSKNINNSPLYAFEDNSSVNSSKNENSLKNSKNNYSFSSFGKNFVLKNKVCKSTKNDENNFQKNKYYNYSDDNPIMAYYMGKNLGNFYLMTDRKSQEELDANQYLNFFPVEEKEIKNKEKDIMSCIYIDNNAQKSQNEIKKEININNNKKDKNEGSNIFSFKNFNKSSEEGQNRENNFSLNLNTNDFIDNNKNVFGNINNKFNTNKNINENQNNFNKIDNPNEIFKLNITKNINNNIPKEKVNNTLDDNNNFINMNNFNLNNINLNNFNLKDINFKDINIEDINLNNFNLNDISFGNSNQIDENNFEFPLSKKKENININDSLTNNNSIFNNKNINDIKLPLSVPNNNFNLDNTDLKEFKLNKEILNELSNLNQKISLDPNYLQFNDNYFNNQLYNTNINNQINLNNIDIGNLNINFNESINSINMLPLNKSFYDYTDDELLEYAIPLIKDQSGCRFLQDKIKINPNFVNDKLFPKIENNIKELCCDPFGNYFLQVLIDILSFTNVDKLLSLIKNDFTNICICPHGTRVVQKLIEKIYLTPDLMNKFISNLNYKELGLIFKSPYGNHIMQKFLSTVHMPEYTKFIYDYTFDNFMDIAETKHGVCVIQKCVSEGDEYQREKIYGLILQNFEALIKDQFGNYLIQYILINTKTKEKMKEIMPLINKIEVNLLDFCKSKFSANVIEKCFENNENYIREHILEYLLKNYEDKIIEILLDQYGIYIIQKALKLNPFYKKKLCNIINQKESELRKIDLNDFKYRGILKIINSNKELGMIFYKTKENNNKNNYYNNSAEIENRNNNYKRGKYPGKAKYHRGNNNKY